MIAVSFASLSAVSRQIWRIPVHGSAEAALIKRFKRADGWFVKRGG
jgi:hypothetical protein